MQFIDEARIEVAGGAGGDGCASFRREKFVPRGGPDGGDGGRGGDVVLIVDSNLSTLQDFRYRTRYHAERGGRGSGNNRTGADGADIELRVPPGTMVRDAATGESIVDLTTEGERSVVARGGRGGRGNAAFASPTRQAPQRAETGAAGGKGEIVLELKLLADVGLVGSPNAGKSTLLSRISAARPRIADYPFTTLTPNLGVVSIEPGRSFVVADIPGLIEGASEGKGLGARFLRHIERTRVLCFLIEVVCPDPGAEYEGLKAELAAWSPELLDLPRVVAWSKADLGEPPAGVAFDDASETHVVSSVTGTGLPALVGTLARTVERVRAEEVATRSASTPTRAIAGRSASGGDDEGR